MLDDCVIMSSLFEGVVTHIDNAEIGFCRSCRQYTVYKANAYVGETLNLVPNKHLFFKVPFIVAVVANEALN